MGLRNLVLLALVALAGVGLASVWSAATAPRERSTKEGFKDDTTDDDIDFFVAVSGALKRHKGSEPTASEVRRTVADMRKKSVAIKDVETFVRSSGGRAAVAADKEPVEKDQKDPETEDKSGGQGKVAARKVKKADKPPPAVSVAVADRLTKELNAIADRVDDLVEEIAKYSQQAMDQPVQASVSEGFANFSSW